MRRLLADADPRVRQDALAALLAEETEQAAAIAAGLADADPGVRAATLAWLADTPMVPVLELIGPIGGER